MSTSSKRMDYENPGTPTDIERFKANLSAKSKEELIEILGNVAQCCDNTGKGYVNQWEDSVRRAVGYVWREVTDANPVGIRQVPCPDCGGTGRETVTLEMAMDAGDRNLVGTKWGCNGCFGDGWILEEVEAQEKEENT